MEGQELADAITEFASSLAPSGESDESRMRGAQGALATILTTDVCKSCDKQSLVDMLNGAICIVSVLGAQVLERCKKSSPHAGSA
jgi:hypothetical protein